MSFEPEATAITASTDSVHSIRRSSVRFFSGTMLSRFTGMLRDIVLAFCFGTNQALAALFVALRLAHFARRLFGEGAFQSAFIPLFEEIRKKSPEHGCLFFRDLSILWTGLLTLLCVITIGALATWRYLLPVEAGTAEILDLMIIMLPSIVPICLFGLNISFLQCQKHYFTAAVAPIFFNLVFIASAVLLRHSSPVESMPLLSIGIVLGCVAQWLVSFLPVFRQCKAVLQNHLFKGISLFSSDIKRLWHPLTLGLLGIGASQINNAVDALFARAADPEGPAQLWFAIRFQQLPLALFGIAVANAILPPLARAIQTNDLEKYHRFLEYGLRNVLALLVPCTGILLVVGMAMINCVYGHGDFGSESVISTTGCLQGYALALIPTGLILVLAPAFYARGNYTIPMRGACFSLILNAVLNSIMVFGFGWKAISVTVATSISTWINAAYLYTELRKELGPLISSVGARSCFKTIFASTTASIVVFSAIALWSFPPVFFQIWTSSGALIPHTILDQLIQLISPLSLFALGLFLFARISQANDILDIIKMKPVIRN